MTVQIYSAFTLFLSLLVEAIPFLLLGVLLSSALLFFIDERQLVARLPRHPFLGAFVGSCVGFFFPVCECGNVPVARRLLMQGMPTSVAIGFLLAAPTINPIVIWSTWVAFRDRPEIVVFRVLGSLAIATIIGCLFSLQQDPRPMLQSALAKRVNLLMSRSLEVKPAAQRSPEMPSLLQSGTFLLNKSGQPIRMDDAVALAAVALNRPIPLEKRLRPFLDNAIQELRELGGILIFGSAIAACVQVFVPREVILDLGQDVISSIAAMMVLAGIVSICSTVDSFFALSFASTFTTSSLLAFLVFGPTIDIKGIGLMLSIFQPRIIFYLFALVAQLTFLFALFHSYFF
ncbi:MAG: permease [Hydrococcus sp. C42_A2020_068]|uniref:permease n=1 Tax=Pleurocapsa sp. PCC 7327 TaxID=118163 RepID=UPI00029F9CA8|nr:permease [Pleurocapsa sp. PCC 7327]AFY76932.1 putative permease [Pleurocapsa sp. PCC 7327]MBF2019521.1 permease [Hydrococcus sp. C42_A2020_068]